jgi:hypothetical protein
MKPPTLKELLADPVYRKYFLTQPNLPHAATLLDNPWFVFAQQYDGKWLGRPLSNYARCITMMKTLYSARDDIRDVSIVSRRVMFGPPDNFSWHARTDWQADGWCSRCRRPTLFRKDAGLHALRQSPVIQPGVRRCYFCGMAYESMLSWAASSFANREVEK